MFYQLITRDMLRQHLGFALDDAGDDARLTAVIAAASNLIESAARRRFMPGIGERRYDIPSQNRHILNLNEDLLALRSLTNGDGQPIPLGDVLHLPGDALQLRAGRSFSYDESPLQAIRVEAVWGWHDDWARAWADSELQLSSELSMISQSCSYTGNDTGLQVGQLLRLGEEYAWLLAHDAGNQSITLLRGAQGSSTSEQASGTPISVYQVPQAVQSLCVRWAAWLYQEPNSNQPQMPAALLQAIAPLRRIRVAS